LQSVPSPAATVRTSASPDAVADAVKDLCIEAASRDGLGFPVRETSPTSANVADAIRAGLIPGLTSLPAADGQRYLYCYNASNVTMGSGAAQPATGAISATYLVFEQSRKVVVHRTTLNPLN
jgi:hypothetical protein